MKTLVKKFLLSRGLVVSRPPGQFDVLMTKLQNAKGRGLNLDCIVDGGAAHGGFARTIKEIYPSATVICVEPRGITQPDLQTVKRELSNIHIAQTLLGPSEGTASFHESGEQSSALPNSRGEAFGATKTVPMTTLDALIAQFKTPWPDLVKLDLQGFELDALRGAEQCMQRAQALLLELSFFPLQRGAPLASEVIQFVADRGFRIYDVPALWHRPLDGALAQGDFLFLKHDHPLRADPRWSVDATFA